ncbi:MAG: hypothetical protein JRI85_07295 [Deltaproteobacteria bacterium]|nr:hypothetical protein [Deltaproteobacteria bacterium]
MGKIQPGIYLEIKKGSIGTGHTAKDVEYKNFWILFSQEDGLALIYLLDNDFNPTGIRETISASEMKKRSFTYIPEGEKRYRNILKKFGRRLIPNKNAQMEKAIPDTSKPIQDAVEKPSQKNKAVTWDVLTGREAKPEDTKPYEPFKRNPSSKKRQSSFSTKKSWWETK